MIQIHTYYIYSESARRDLSYNIKISRDSVESQGVSRLGKLCQYTQLDELYPNMGKQNHLLTMTSVLNISEFENYKKEFTHLC